MRPTAKTKGYLPTLDGWRAVAIAGVLLAHSPDQKRPLFLVSAVRDRGWLGVNLFFAISGLLICSRLLREEATDGRISLTNFYIRRSFRILPAALAYLLAVALLGLLGTLPWDGPSWFGALFFYRNYVYYYLGSNGPNWFTGQFWSLSVEEHFYLILPSLLVFLPGFRKRAIVLLTCACFLYMGVNVYVLHDPSPFVYQRTEFCLPSLLVPALYSLLLRQDNVLRAVRRYLHPPVGLLLGALIWQFRFPGAPHDYKLAPAFAIAALFPLLLLSTVHHPGHFVSRFLELAPLRFIGRISYSLYIWQQLFFSRFFAYPGYAIRTLQKPWVNLLCIVLCALASYYFIEQPFIRMGQWIVERRRTAHPPAS